MPKYSTPKETSEYLGVSLHTLRRWEKQGKIQTIRTPSGQRRYDIASYTGLSNQRTERSIIAYARVSSRGQQADLDKQIAVLLELYPRALVISDIASGLNFKRPGLRILFQQVRKGNVKSVVVAHKDRLARFGFDLIQWLLEQDGVRIMVLNQDNLSPERELVEDIIAIVHVFSYRLYGLKKYKSAIKEDPNLPKS
ncbi:MULTISPECIES: IS607 family transposase [Nostoc]|uniref:IS607 family transposase n=2 Tax=Nostoc TaxID=1177 RepID=A0ABR8IJF7_9NOSO|nr:MULTISPECIES: IS607 family transposase [Nostoc]MBD2565257.1 IS607 family transposase [Nostoc linckia FACHB-391]MBD2651313.1 IS607 family transposase [Nostoc foliaceum FACHB-393]